MAHFAELDENNKVLQVVVVSNDVITVNGVENEQLGIDFLNELLPDSGTWIQTSYNANIRKNYAGKGFQYDGDLDAFIPPDTGSYKWNEETQTWDNEQ